MIDVILFPCEMFSMNKVDSCFQSEFDAVSKNGNFEIIFYDYEEFAENGNLRLSKKVENPVFAMLRGWMLNGGQYKDFYEKLISKNIRLITSPEQYCQMHLFPNIYPLILEDTPKMLVYPIGTKVNLEEIRQNFKRFMIKDFVKSEKGSAISKFFDSDISEKDFFQWLEVFKEYRSRLFTDGICVKEYVDLKKYGENTNEWRAFYLFRNVLSVSRNSGQQDCASEVPSTLVEKYKNLPSPFFTVDFAELSCGTWKVLETGDGQVSGVPKEQNAEEFFKRVREVSSCEIE